MSSEDIKANHRAENERITNRILCHTVSVVNWRETMV